MTEMPLKGLNVSGIDNNNMTKPESLPSVATSDGEEGRASVYVSLPSVTTFPRLAMSRD